MNPLEPASPSPDPTQPAILEFPTLETAECRILVVNEDGLHMRVAHRICEIAKTIPSTIAWESPYGKADSTSMLNLLSLAAAQGTELVLTFRGPTAHADLQTFLGKLSPEEFRPLKT